MIRKKASLLSVLLIWLTLIPTLGFSADVKIKAVPVADQIYMIAGQGGNIGLFIGEDGTFLGAFKMKLPPVAKAGLPVVTFSKNITFHLNGDTVMVKHVPHAHTDGDSFIYFQAANVIHAGDLFFNGFYPFIDVDHGGSLKGMIKGVDKVLRVADDQTKIISGHGPLGDKQQLVSYRKMLGVAYERLSTLKAEGKTAEEAAAAKPLADLEASWGNGLFKSDQWIKLIYSGV